MSTELHNYDAWKLASPEDTRQPAPGDRFRDAISRLEKLAHVRHESETHAYDVRVSETSKDSARFELALEFDVACAFADDLPEAFAKSARAAVERMIQRLGVK